MSDAHDRDDCRITTEIDRSARRLRQALLDSHDEMIGYRGLAYANELLRPWFCIDVVGEDHPDYPRARMDAISTLRSSVLGPDSQPDPCPLPEVGSDEWGWKAHEHVVLCHTTSKGETWPSNGFAWRAVLQAYGSDWEVELGHDRGDYKARGEAPDHTAAKRAAEKAARGMWRLGFSLDTSAGYPR